jgi:hypothetical protein
MVTFYWLGGSGSWFDSANWNTDPSGVGQSGIPGAQDTAVIASGTADLGSSSPTVAGFDQADDATLTGTGVLTVTGAADFKEDPLHPSLEAGSGTTGIIRLTYHGTSCRMPRNREASGYDQR